MSEFYACSVILWEKKQQQQQKPSLLMGYVMWK
jgi:hypothetical protein